MQLQLTPPPQPNKGCAPDELVLDLETIAVGKHHTAKGPDQKAVTATSVSARMLKIRYYIMMMMFGSIT